MTRRIYLYFILTILLGAVLGGAGIYYYIWHMGRLQRPFSKTRAIKHLTEELSLTNAQIQQLGPIFDESAAKMQDLDKQVEALHQETRAHIRQVLTPEQVTKFDEYVRQIDARRRRGGLSRTR